MCRLPCQSICLSMCSWYIHKYIYIKYISTVNIFPSIHPPRVFSSLCARVHVYIYKADRMYHRVCLCYFYVSVRFGLYTCSLAVHQPFSFLFLQTITLFFQTTSNKLCSVPNCTVFGVDLIVKLSLYMYILFSRCV